MHFCKIFKITATILLVLRWKKPAVAQHHMPRANLFMREDCLGSFFTTTMALPNLWLFDDAKWAEKTASYMIVGPWIYYRHARYNSDSDQLAEWHYSEAEECINFDKVKFKVGSLQVAGHTRDFNATALTVFQRQQFQGSNASDYVFDGDVAQINLGATGSFIISGPHSWRLYQYNNFKGESFCASPKERRFWYTLSSFGVKLPRIRSAKVGC